MVTWSDAHRLGMLEASRLLRQMGIDAAHRVQIEDLADQLGLVVHFKPLPRLAGAYIAQDGAPPGILVNNKLPWSKQRLTIAHEIGHHRFAHQSSLDLDVGTFDETLNDQEKVAEAFAAWILMPRKAILALLERSAIHSPLELYAMSLRLGVSYQALGLHLSKDLRLIPHSQASEWLRIAPKKIKQELLGTTAALGWTDVHVIGTELDGEILYVGPGDALVVEGGSALSIDEIAFERDDVAGKMIIRIDPYGTVNPRDARLDGSMTVTIRSRVITIRLALDRKRLGIHYRWFGDGTENHGA